uniref:Uncharacterized protein n=1 Tax=Pyxicephalus adspersus TaxID=30357 RepID=A0AAV2ZVL0_PYXAD|nr:TPA: hypothetical protein GDO54_016687 [Pyxicephalus adspersus]
MSDNPILTPLRRGLEHELSISGCLLPPSLRLAQVHQISSTRQNRLPVPLKTYSIKTIGQHHTPLSVPLWKNSNWTCWIALKDYSSLPMIGQGLFCLLNRSLEGRITSRIVFRDLVTTNVENS